MTLEEYFTRVKILSMVIGVIYTTISVFPYNFDLSYVDSGKNTS